MIRVAFIAHLSELSGAGTSLLAKARHLDEKRFEKVLVLPGEGPLLDEARAQGVETMVIPNPERSIALTGAAEWVRILPGRMRYVRALAAFLRTWGADIAYVNSTASIFAGMAAVLARKRIVWQVHENIENPSRPVRAKLRFVEAVSSGIVFDSASGELRFPARRVEQRLVVPNWIDVDACASAQTGEDIDHELGLRDNEDVVTTNGLFFRKAPDVFLEAAAIVMEQSARPVRFVVVGVPSPAEFDFAQKMREMAESEPLHGHVVFAGVRRDFPSLVKRSTLFVSPSRNEARPIAVTEAMAAGTPVVATDVGDCRELLEDGELGYLVPPENAEVLAAAMLRSLNNPEDARQKAAAAQAKVLREYGTAEFWKPLEQLLARVAK